MVSEVNFDPRLYPDQTSPLLGPRWRTVGPRGRVEEVIRNKRSPLVSWWPMMHSGRFLLVNFEHDVF